ncbi:hypothetical protein [Desulfoferula mesophila]|uniref:Uncharacterized protein n=1 Tax=Desulfoferula mesophila TaxID=3058419 RepID=A0AAU9EZV0_9BACT|nr:hypothetical protein FAK_31970 [Desulfoferula mesophilus]
MRITDHELRSVLSAHARRISRASASKRRVSTAGGDESTQLTLSIEARRRQLVDRITGDIVAGLGQRRRRLDRSIDDPRDLALDRLSLEYGQSLYLEDTVHGTPLFSVSDPEAGGELHLLPEKEQIVLRSRLAVLEEQANTSLAP